MPVAVASRGLKRICPSCGTRYYDFNKRPVLCPDCKTEFTGEIKIKARRGRPAAIDDESVLGNEGIEVSETAENEDDVELHENEDTVSLDDVEEGNDDENDDDIDIEDLDDDIDDLDDDDDDDDDDDEDEDEEDDDDR